ncbi:MAG: chemotaxis protein CheW [Gemmatimonadota bacterium]|jgi:chemotaxis signal transduction protein
MDDREQAPAPPPGPEFRRVQARCGSRSVLIPLDRITEILMPQVLTRIPGAGPEVCGLVGVRGRVLTVFDLCGLLGEGPLDPERDHRILVVKAADRVVGLAVPEVETIAEDELESVSEGRSGTDGPVELDLDRLIRAKLA